MVGLNDILEFEEKNFYSLEMDFIESLSIKELKDMLVHTDLVTKMKHAYPDKWGSFVSEQYDKSLGEK